MDRRRDLRGFRWTYRGMPDDAAPSSHSTARSSPPTFLTVEEAAAVLRIGRTAAYLLARRWQDSGGAEGLPVVRFGRLLRVPVHELERLASGAIDVTGGVPTRPVPEPAPSTPAEPSSTRTTLRRPTRSTGNDQPTLFPEAS